jgi:hypothetical protein
VTLIAAHGWDVLGAESAGMRGIWVDRLERRWPFPTDAPRRVPDLAEAAAMAISDRPDAPAESSRGTEESNR